jgi:hypothetical protein
MSVFGRKTPISTLKSVMWDRWKQGESLHAIARLLNTSQEISNDIARMSHNIAAKSVGTSTA